MEIHLNLHRMLLTISASVAVFLLVSMYSPSARAAVSEVYQPSQAAPTVLAWYYGPRWRGYGYRGGWYRDGYGYGARCARSCWRNEWGRVVCARRCW